MTKEEWKEWYERFKEISVEYYFAEQEYKNGKNKSIRDTAERKMDILRGRARNYSELDMEVYRLIEYPEEMFSYQWFRGDLEKLLGKIKEKCNEK